MEDALETAGCAAVVLRPGAIYGPHPTAREWTLVRKVALGHRDLPLPDGGVQLFHRVAIDRLSRAILAAAERATDEPWACNVDDPQDRDYSGLARRIGELLDWEWEPGGFQSMRTSTRGRPPTPYSSPTGAYGRTWRHPTNPIPTTPFARRSSGCGSTARRSSRTRPIRSRRRPPIDSRRAFGRGYRRSAHGARDFWVRHAALLGRLDARAARGDPRRPGGLGTGAGLQITNGISIFVRAR